MNENKSLEKKSGKPSTKTNFVFNLLVQLITYLIPLITSPYLSRVLGPTGIGENSFVGSVASYFTLIIAFGYLTYGIKEISRLQNNKKEYSNVFWNIVFSRGFLFAICFIIYIFMACFWGFGKSGYTNLFIIYSITLVTGFLDITYLFQGLENFRIVSLISIVVKILAASCFFIFVKTSDDLLIYVLICCLETFTIAVIMWLFALKKINKPDFHEIHVFKCLKNNVQYFLPTIAISVYTILDRTMMGYLTTVEQIGYYEQAYKIIALVTALINCLSPIMLSRISSLIESGNEAEVNHKIIQMSEVYALIGWPCVFGLYAISRYFIPAFFGDEYVDAIGVIYWLIPLIMIIPVSNQIGSAYYVPRNKISMTTIFFVIGALTNFLANFVSIKYMGAQGAALTSLIAETIISSCFIIFSWKHVPYKEMVKTFVKPLISALIMFTVLMLLDYLVLDTYLDNLIVKTIISLFTGILIYAISVLILKEPMVMAGCNHLKKTLIQKKKS